MTALDDPPPVAARMPRIYGWLFALAAIVIIAHGCHGDDIDHEPGVTDRDRSHGAE